MDRIKTTFEAFNGDKDSMSWVNPIGGGEATKSNNWRTHKSKFKPNDWRQKMGDAIEEAIDYNVETQTILNFVFDYLKNKNS